MAFGSRDGPRPSGLTWTGIGAGVLAGILLAARSAAWDGAGVAPRVVSLSPIATEVVLALGARDALIGVDAESAGRAGSGSLPIVDLQQAVELLPDLVVLSHVREDEAWLVDSLRAGGTEVVEFTPHDFDEAFALCRVLGVALGLEQEAHRLVRDRSRDLALLSRSSLGQRRPRIAAIVSVTPPAIAGGHSFVTDLIEIAGAESVTHGTEEARIALEPGSLSRLAPEIVLVAIRHPPSALERERISADVPADVRLEVIEIDAETIWWRDALAVAQQLRSIVLATTAPGHDGHDDLGVSSPSADDVAPDRD